MIDDGYPSAPLTPSHVDDSQALVEEVKRAEKAGIEMIGVGIESNSVSHFYSRHAVVNDIPSLPSELLKQFRSLFKGA